MKQLALLLIGSLLLTGCQSSPTEQPPISVNKLVQSTKSWDGRELPKYPAGQPEVTILRIEIQPGAELPLHHHPVINAGVLLKGELTVVSKKGETLHLKAGDPIIEVVDKVHYGKNEGSDVAEIIVFYAAAKGETITVKE